MLFIFFTSFLIKLYFHSFILFHFYFHFFLVLFPILSVLCKCHLYSVSLSLSLQPPSTPITYFHFTFFSHLFFVSLFYQGLILPQFLPCQSFLNFFSLISRQSFIFISRFFFHFLLPSLFYHGLELPQLLPRQSSLNIFFLISLFPCYFLFRRCYVIAARALHLSVPTSTRSLRLFTSTFLIFPPILAYFSLGCLMRFFHTNYAALNLIR